MGFERNFARLAGLLVLSASAAAFEPGAPRICEPSADGQTFVCRDKGSAAPIRSVSQAAPPAAASAATIRAADPTASTSSDTASTQVGSKPRNTRALPDYLRQNPSFTDSPAAAQAEPRASAPEPAREPAAPARADPVATPAKTVVADKQPAAQSRPANEPSGIPSVATKPAVPVATDGPALNAQAPPGQHESSATPAAADAFNRLPASHFTLVLASVRNRDQLDGLVISLQHLPGQLYLLRLTMPDGDWYSLCWSDYPDLDSARAARLSLPADAAITSGWPRRIGLLQKELPH